jgi:hypothetical protein
VNRHRTTPLPHLQPSRRMDVPGMNVLPAGAAVRVLRDAQPLTRHPSDVPLASARSVMRSITVPTPDDWMPAASVRTAVALGRVGRDAGIRTRDLLHPKQARYQAALHPEGENRAHERVSPSQQARGGAWIRGRGEQVLARAPIEPQTRPRSAAARPRASRAAPASRREPRRCAHACPVTAAV